MPHSSRPRLAIIQPATGESMPPESSSFGVMDIDGSMIRSFREKSRDDMGWINGGFMVVEPGALEYIENDTTAWEREPLETLASRGQLSCYKHHGFWQCMDTLRDKEKLESLLASGKAPWKYWK